MYLKYEYRLIFYFVYVKKFNCYFVFGKDFFLKVCKLLIRNIIFFKNWINIDIMYYEVFLCIGIK